MPLPFDRFFESLARSHITLQPIGHGVRDLGEHGAIQVTVTGIALLQRLGIFRASTGGSALLASCRKDGLLEHLERLGDVSEQLPLVCGCM